MKQDKQKVLPKRLIVDLAPPFHQQIKEEALFRHMTIKQYVIEAILERIKRDKRYQ